MTESSISLHADITFAYCGYKPCLLNDMYCCYSVLSLLNVQFKYDKFKL